MAVVEVMSYSRLKQLFISSNILKRINQNTIKVRHYSSPTDNVENKSVEKLGGFARAFEKYSTPIQETKDQDLRPFAQLLRTSKFIDLGDPADKIVTGTIFHIVGDDLYIDFGWKFHCVCPRPTRDGSEYVRGAKVRLRVKDLELSSKFLGSEKDLTLLEADAFLIGLISRPVQSTSTDIV